MADEVVVQIPAGDKESRDLEERKKNEKKIRSMVSKLYGVHEQMYALRFSSERDPRSMETEMKAFSSEVMKLEIKIANTVNSALDAFELQLNLDDIKCSDLFADSIRASTAPIRKDRSTFRRSRIPKKSAAEELHEGGFMRTASTRVIEDKTPKGLWQSLAKMWSEWKYQTTVADAQYIASRDPEIKEIEIEIAKLRAAVREMSQRKQLSKRDQRVMQDLQDQLKLRLQQKERYVRAAFPSKQERRKSQKVKQGAEDAEMISLDDSKAH